MPSANTDIAPWIPPPPTQTENIDWAPLPTLDLSRITGDDFTEVPDDLVAEASEAFHKIGFVYGINHGLSWEQVLRQFSIGQFAFNGVSEEDKAKFKADILGTGSFVGYKEQGHWRLNGIQDRIEQLNFGSKSFTPEARQRLYPPAIQSLIPEIEAFEKFNHDVIFRKLLSVLSRVLKLPADYLWKLSSTPAKNGVDLLRYAMYHNPPKADDEALGGVRLQGHTDFNSVSILWSQPITSLEVLMPDNTWRLVKHRDNAIVVNLGDALHFLSGGYLKQTIHRVIAAPADQSHYTRNGVFWFGFQGEDTPLEPLVEHSEVVREAYAKRSEGFWDERKRQGLPVPTVGEWEALRVKAYGQMGAKKGDDGHDVEEIAGHKVVHYNDTNKAQAPAQAQPQAIKA